MKLRRASDGHDGITQGAADAVPQLSGPRDTSGLACVQRGFDSRSPLEADDPVVLHHEIGEVIGACVRSVLPLEIRVRDRTGPRTRPSDVNRDLGPDDLVEELPKLR